MNGLLPLFDRSNVFCFSWESEVWIPVRVSCGYDVFSIWPSLVFYGVIIALLPTRKGDWVLTLADWVGCIGLEQAGCPLLGYFDQSLHKNWHLCDWRGDVGHVVPSLPMG